MTEFPEPEQGLVIRYSYLWRPEADRGRSEGRKDRPCVVVMAVRREGQNIRVYVSPITHTAPRENDNAVEISAQTKARLKLDNAQSWIITNELNVFTWAGPDIRPANASDPQQKFAFGYLPYRTARQVADAVLVNVKRKTGKLVERDEVKGR